jgi:hypothetical protein
MPASQLEPVATLGIDVGKNSFHLVNLDERGAVILRQKLSPGQVVARPGRLHMVAPRAQRLALPNKSTICG